MMEITIADKKDEKIPWEFLRSDHVLAEETLIGGYLK
jgi:hypothetical protein